MASVSCFPFIGIEADTGPRLPAGLVNLLGAEPSPAHKRDSPVPLTSIAALEETGRGRRVLCLGVHLAHFGGKVEP